MSTVEFGPYLSTHAELYRLYSVECSEKVLYVPTTPARRSVRVYKILALSSRDSKNMVDGRYYRLRILRYEVFVYDDDGAQDISKGMDEWVDGAETALDTEPIDGVGATKLLKEEELLSMRYLEKYIELRPGSIGSSGWPDDLYFAELCRQERERPSHVSDPHQTQVQTQEKVMPRKFFTKKHTGTMVERLNAPSRERDQVVSILIGLGGGDQATIRMTENEFDQKFEPYNTLIVEEFTVVDDLELDLTYYELIPPGFGPVEARETHSLRVPLSQIVEKFRN